MHIPRSRSAWPAAVMLALLAGACGGVTHGSTPTATPIEPSAVASAVPSSALLPTTLPTEPPIPTERPTPTPVLNAPCPTDKVLSVASYVAADPACFTGSVRIRGWLDFPPALGWEGPGVEPAWLYYPPELVLPALWTSVPPGPDHTCGDTNPSCAWFFLHVAPDSDVSLGLKPRWVVVTGHIDDPAAATCHYLPSDPEEGAFDDADAIRQCASNLVVTAIEAAPAG